MDGIRYWIETEGSGHYFFIAFPICLLILLIMMKGRRSKFVIPSLIISLVIINPWFYKKWDELGLYAYWRILWIIPVTPVVATVVPNICEKIKKTCPKVVAAGVGAGLIALGGTFLFNGAGGSFVEAPNAAKLPDDVVRIADRLLEKKDSPRIVAQDPIGVYIRQYSGEISSLYGRDVYGYMIPPSPEARIIYNKISDAEMDFVALFMLDNDYDYIIYQNDTGNQFELLDSVGEYKIAKPNGARTKIKKRNEQGLITSITTINVDGEPINNEEGYATIHYEYDEYGNISKEFRTDVEGIGVEDQFGCAGHKRKYDNKGHIVSDTKLGLDGTPAIGELGFAEVRRLYKNNRLVSESYYDINGEPTTHINGYARFITEFEEDGRFKSREYFDVLGNPIDCIEGYSKIVWQQEENGSTQSAVFFDSKGNEIRNADINYAMNIEYDPDGWTEWMTPAPNMTNCCFYLGNINLGEKKAGDIYHECVEIQFRDVIAANDFCFYTQGAVDYSWNIGNIWDGSFVHLNKAPENGIHNYECSYGLSERMAAATLFELSFRCDNWASGSFRVRNVIIQKEN